MKCAALLLVLMSSPAMADPTVVHLACTTDAQVVTEQGRYGPISQRQPLPGFAMSIDIDFQAQTVTATRFPQPMGFRYQDETHNRIITGATATSDPGDSVQYVEYHYFLIDRITGHLDYKRDIRVSSCSKSHAECPPSIQTQSDFQCQVVDKPKF
jgi:hypothetical protein